jgi:diguanylate cyclase (GGDEF)-like protein/PAS domain S-box-containing protein
VISINTAFSRLTGYGSGEMLGKLLSETPFRPTDLQESDARMEHLHRYGAVTGEVPRQSKDGKPLALWVTATCVRNGAGRIVNYVRVFTDISLLKESQRKLELLASFDALTGLPNRHLLHDRLVQALQRTSREGGRMGLLFIDLDGFKEVNDTLGHDVGDLLLNGVVARMQECVRTSDSVCRFGGDEFVILLEPMDDAADAVTIGERIVAALSPPFLIEGHRIKTTASIGIALNPEDGTDAITLLKNADVAMYKAKRSGRNRLEFFSVSVEDAAAVA